LATTILRPQKEEKGMGGKPVAERGNMFNSLEDYKVQKRRLEKTGIPKGTGPGSKSGCAKEAKAGGGWSKKNRQLPNKKGGHPGKNGPSKWSTGGVTEKEFIHHRKHWKKNSGMSTFRRLKNGRIRQTTPEVKESEPEGTREERIGGLKQGKWGRPSAKTLPRKRRQPYSGLTANRPTAARMGGEDRKSADKQKKPDGVSG